MTRLRALAVGGEARGVLGLLAEAVALPVEDLGSLAGLRVLLAAGLDLAVDLLVWRTADPAAELDDLRALARLRPGLAVLVVVLRPDAAGAAELAVEASRQRGELRAAAVAGPDEASLRVAVARLVALAGWPGAPAAPASRTGAAPVPAPSRGGGPVLTVFGPKGGSGKTALALNLAALAASLPGGCVLVDADLETPDATVLSGATGGADLVDLLPALGGGAEADLPLARHRQAGFHLVAGPARPELAPLVQAEHVAALLALLRRRFGAVVVDTCGRLGDDATLAALEAADRVLLLVTPEPAAARRAVAARELLARAGWRDEARLCLVVNGVTPDAPLDVARLEALLALPAAAAIPYDPAAFRRAALAGAPLAVAEPDHPAVRAAAQVLVRLGLAHLAGPGRGGGWRQVLRRVLGRERT